MKTYARPTELAKTLKLRFRVGDLDLPERRKRYTTSWGEEEVDAQMCPCGKAAESRTHILRGAGAVVIGTYGIHEKKTIYLTIFTNNIGSY